MWVEVVRARWIDPFSRLRREQFELDLVKDFLLQRIPPALEPDRKTIPLGTPTRPMTTELMESYFEKEQMHVSP